MGSDERQIVDRLRRGESRGFDEAYDRYRARIFAFLVRLCQRQSTAEELSQETWLRLARHARRLDPDTRLGAWLFTVARNLFVSHRRRKLLDLDAFDLLPPSSGVGAPEAESPFGLVAANELQQRLERAIASLPWTYREVVLLVAIEQLDQSTAAAILQLKPAALRKRLSRARALLGERLAADERPGELTTEAAR